MGVAGDIGYPMNVSRPACAAPILMAMFPFNKTCSPSGLIGSANSPKLKPLFSASTDPKDKAILFESIICWSLSLPLVYLSLLKSSRILIGRSTSSAKAPITTKFAALLFPVCLANSSKSIANALSDASISNSPEL